MPSSKVICQLEQLIEWRGKPEKVRVDNGPEFIAEKMKDYCRKENIELSFIQPGEPMQNSLIERFNRAFRTEFLSVYFFENISPMRNYAEIWMRMYNNERPHRALQYLIPRDSLSKYGKLNQNSANEFPTFRQNFNNDNNKILTKKLSF